LWYTSTIDDTISISVQFLSLENDDLANNVATSMNTARDLE